MNRIIKEMREEAKEFLNSTLLMSKMTDELYDQIKEPIVKMMTTICNSFIKSTIGHKFKQVIGEDKMPELYEAITVSSIIFITATFNDEELKTIHELYKEKNPLEYVIGKKDSLSIRIKGAIYVWMAAMTLTVHILDLLKVENVKVLKKKDAREAMALAVIFIFFESVMKKLYDIKPTSTETKLIISSKVVFGFKDIEDPAERQERKLAEILGALGYLYSGKIPDRNLGVNIVMAVEYLFNRIFDVVVTPFFEKGKIPVEGKALFFDDDVKKELLFMKATLLGQNNPNVN